MSKNRKSATTARRPAGRSSSSRPPAKKTPAPRSRSSQAPRKGASSKKPAAQSQSQRPQQQRQRAQKQGTKSRQHLGSKAPRTPQTTSHAPTRGQTVARGSLQAGRYLWALVTGLVIAALLFEPTWSWMVGVGVFFLAAGEFSGLWMLVSGYIMACTPAAFGLLIATGRFWLSLTHSLWIGAVYLVVGFLLLDRILGVLGGGL